MHPHRPTVIVGSIDYTLQIARTTVVGPMPGSGTRPFVIEATLALWHNIATGTTQYVAADRDNLQVRLA